jgi:aminomethyltransferase
MDIYRDEERVGTLTSGTFSPTLKIGIGIGLVDPEVKLGEVIEIDVRGRKLRAEVVKLPFVPSRVR